MSKHDKIVVRPFTAEDLFEVTEMDNCSGNDVRHTVEELEYKEINDYSWGIFVNDVLVGYCTIGYADGVGDKIENHPLHGDDAYLLSDVYIKPEFRNKGYGTTLVKETIKGRFASEKKLAVFLEILSCELEDFYSKIGFEIIPDTDNSCMVLTEVF